MTLPFRALPSHETKLKTADWHAIPATYSDQRKHDGFGKETNTYLGIISYFQYPSFSYTSLLHPFNARHDMIS